MTKAEEKFERAKAKIYRLKELADRQGARVTLEETEQGKMVFLAVSYNDKICCLFTHLKKMQRTSCVRKAHAVDRLDNADRRIPWRDGLIKAEVFIEGRANRLAFEKKLHDRVGA